MNILENPTAQEAYRAVKDGSSKHRVVIIVGSCWVDYEGRASSFLESGERMVILKPDGSALVHRPKDYAPVNWQPPGSIFRTRVKDGKLHLRAFRRKEHEVLEVGFDKVLMVSVFDLKDAGDFYLHATEKDMQEAILAQPSLLEEGFRPITSEKPVDPGFIDILGVDKEGTLTVVEIKRNPATVEAVLQLKKYMDVFSKESEPRGILVAPELAKGAQALLASLGLEFRALSPQDCSEILKRKRSKTLTEFFNP
ncbi:MAG: endonuclease NucS [Candidatus Bathyarchaeota archaeon]|jgi:RecB family endonuclease NucS